VLNEGIVRLVCDVGTAIRYLFRWLCAHSFGIVFHPFIRTWFLFTYVDIFYIVKLTTSRVYGYALKILVLGFHSTLKLVVLGEIGGWSCLFSIMSSFANNFAFRFWSGYHFLLDLSHYIIRGSYVSAHAHVSYSDNPLI